MHPRPNGTRQCHQTRNIGPSVRVCQLNIEGISKSKTEHLSRMLKENNVDVVILQETHAADDQQLSSRGSIEGYTLIGAINHLTYGSATYARSNIENISIVQKQSLNDIYLITIEISGIKIANIYKPPNTAWPPGVLPVYHHPAVYAGDFNSHHSLWRYPTDDQNGLELIDWVDNNNFHLVFDAKDIGTFRSGRWKRDYNPDLCFVTRNIEMQPLQTGRRVLEGFPHSQHRPVLLDIGAQVPIVNSTPRPRWNFGKADWQKFSKELDAIIRWIPPTHKGYVRFVGAVKASAQKSVPRGYREDYIPGWSVESDRLYQEFLENGDTEIADDLLHSLDHNRRDRWINTVENLDFTHSSRRAWSLLRKLGGTNTRVCEKPNINLELVANRIVSLSQAPRVISHSRKIKHSLRELKQNSPASSEISEPFTIQEVNVAIDHIKLGKAAGFDNIFPEFLKYSGPNTRSWLSKFFTNIMETGILPKEFKRTKVIALLKPGKPNNLADSYRPIALLSTCYKLLERIVYNRIAPHIGDKVPPEQAGFRTDRSCVDQVLSLTANIEAGFQKHLKTGAVFIDLTAAYDTVWREGLIYKLLRTVPCQKTARLINNMLSNRMFQVFMNDTSSKTRMLNNGLPQGSVLAPLLFNLYISDLPATRSRKFGYADDWTLATQHRNMTVIEETLTEDLIIMNSYFKKWRLRPNMSKTEVTCFHLNNKLARTQLTVESNGALLNHNPFPKYLGITLDRTLSYKRHLENTSGKLKTRNNIVQKLAGTTWGASASVLRSTSLGLVYPVAEYGAPIWLNSVHTHKIDRQLNTTMRIISGTIRSTPLPWLPLLSNIAPPDLRRSQALLREHEKIMRNMTLPIHEDYNDQVPQRLRSRRPPFYTAEGLKNSNFNLQESWTNSWHTYTPSDWIRVNDPTTTQPGFNLPRHLWSALNRIRTNHGRCAESFFRWGILASPECDCGAPSQSMRHIATECPLRCYPGITSDINLATPDVIEWLRQLDIRP